LEALNDERAETKGLYMTLADLLEKRGRLFYGRKVRCPFHDDTTPSGLLNDNSIHCFTCARTFSARQVFIKLGEHSEPEVKKMVSREPLFEEKEILFLL
jgi:hypothetical protein